MHKKIIICIIFCFVVACFAGSFFYVRNRFNEGKVHTENSIKKEQGASYQACNYNNNCKLYINGIELSNDHYVKLNYEYQYVELPLLATLDLLGAQISYQNNIILIEYNNTSLKLDTNRNDFGLKIIPGVDNAVRKRVGSELIVDSESTGLFSKMMGATIQIDFDKSVVCIETKK